MNNCTNISNQQNQGLNLANCTVNLNTENSLDYLPNELALEIFSYLDDSDLNKVAYVSKKHYTLSENDIFWEKEAKKYPILWNIKNSFKKAIVDNMQNAVNLALKNKEMLSPMPNGSLLFDESLVKYL